MSDHTIHINPCTQAIKIGGATVSVSLHLNRKKRNSLTVPQGKIFEQNKSSRKSSTTKSKNPKSQFTSMLEEEQSGVKMRTNQRFPESQNGKSRPNLCPLVLRAFKEIKIGNSSRLRNQNQLSPKKSRLAHGSLLSCHAIQRYLLMIRLFLNRPKIKEVKSGVLTRRMKI